jgi:hypothetical protein
MFAVVPHTAGMREVRPFALDLTIDKLDADSATSHHVMEAK